jgi:hypothetical protein
MRAPAAALVLLVTVSPARLADGDVARARDAPSVARPEDARALQLAAARDYRASLARLLPFREAAVARAGDAMATRRTLVARGLVAARDVAESERALDEARAALAATLREIGAADTLLVEVEAAIVGEPSPSHRGTR